MGFLGTGASTAADVNLLSQLVVVALLIAGRWMLSDKKRARLHGQLMVFAVVVTGVGIAIVMLPSLVFGFGAITSDPTIPGSLISIFHSIIGGAAWLYGAYLSLIWGLKPTTVECYKRKSAMRLVFIAWLAAAVLGVGFYVYYYVV